MTSRQTYGAVPTDGNNLETSERDVNGSYESGRRNFVRKAIEVVRQNTGLLLVVAAQAFFAMMNTAVQRLHKVDPPVTTLQLMAIRMIFTTAFCLIYMFYANIPYPVIGPPGVRLLLLCRGIGGSFGLFGLYYSLQYLSLSDATVLTFLVPTTTAVAATLFLKEVYTAKQAMSGFVSLGGVILIARPPFLFGEQLDSHRPDHVDPAQRLLAVGSALMGVAGSTVAYTCLRAIGKQAHPMHAMLAFSLQCIIGSTIGMILTGTSFILPTEPKWLALLFIIGLFGFLAQMLLTMGFQREAAGRASMAVYTQLTFAMILEFIFFHTFPATLSLIGAALIIVSALYVALTKPAPRTVEIKSSKPSDVESTDRTPLLQGNDSSLESSRSL